MNRIFKITIWTVFIVSIILIFVTLFSVVAVGTAGHSAGSSSELGLTLLYFISLPFALFPNLPPKFPHRLKKNPAILLLLIGIGFCLYGVYDNMINKFGVPEYFIVGIPLILLTITLIGILKKGP